MRRRPWPGARLAIAVLCAGVAAQGCESTGVEGGLDFERMVVQPSKDAYQASGAFDDGMAMRTPPAGTVPHAHEAPDPVLPYTMESLERGQDRFGIYCAPCHGFDGLGSTPVAAAMELRRPPPLTDPAIQARPDRWLYQVVTGGYGLMPGYGAQLPARDRWAVVGYMRALQLSYRVPLDSLSVSERTRVLERLGAGRTP